MGRVYSSRSPGFVLLLGVALAPIPAVADTVRLQMHVPDPGPFPPGVGGLFGLSVSVEILDTEGDGPDTQGVSLAHWNIILDGDGTRMPYMTWAYTGEFGYDGSSARVSYLRYEDSPDSQELFLGGFGFWYDWQGWPGASGGLDDVSLWMGNNWYADVQPNAPALQPFALAGVGYGERPAGGIWLLAHGQIPIPTAPGVYGVELVNEYAYTVLPEADLTVDHLGLDSWTYVHPAEERLGDSFTFTVLPEPNCLVWAVLAFAALGRDGRCRTTRAHWKAP